MAVIGKIRSYSGLLMATVGIAMVAFIIGDPSNIKCLGGNQEEKVGEIAGEDITYREFIFKVEEQVNQYKNAYGVEVDENVMKSIRDEVWNNKIKELVYNKEFEKLGLNISEEEIEDLVYGVSPSNLILRFFMGQDGKLPDFFIDPVTGGLRPNSIREAEKNLSQNYPRDYEKFKLLKNIVPEEAVQNKYLSLISNGLFVTDLEAQKRNVEDNEIRQIRYVSRSYAAIPDKDITVSDAEIEKYYNENKEDYKQDKEKRVLKYVSFKVIPSKKDSQLVINNFKRIYTELQSTVDDSLFINRESEVPYYGAYQKREDVSKQIDSVVFNSSIGAIIGPYIEENSMKLTKLLDKQLRPDSLRAKHIFIIYDNQELGIQVGINKERAKIIVDSVYAAIKQDTSKFSLLAGKYSMDQYRQSGGEIGWFVDGTMIPEINNKCIKLNKGELTTFESERGFHILLLENKTKAIEKVKLGNIVNAIEAGKETIEKAYSQASKFSAENQTVAQFESYVIANKVDIRGPYTVFVDDERIGGMSDIRTIMHWVYKQEEPSISDIFDINNEYIIVALTSIVPEGYLPLEEVKNSIVEKIKIDKKAERFINEMKDIKDLGSLAQKFTLNVDTLDFVNYSNNRLLGIEELDVIGKICALKNGQTSNPLKGNRGVFVVKIDNVIVAPKVTDLSNLKMQIDRVYKYNVNSVFEAIKKASNIEDKRAYYF